MLYKEFYMQIGMLLLTLLPIVIILFLLIVWKKPADISGIIGWAAISIVAIFVFSTSLEVIFRSTAAGLIRSFSVSLIVATSLLQMALMEKTGALKRVIIFIKTICCENKAVQIMMINVGFGTLMVAVGATPVSLLPPILIAMGYSTYVAIALPAIGYDSLCTYALLGAPIVVFVDMANGFLGKGHEISLSQVGSVFFYFLPVVSMMIGFCMPWIAGRWNALKKGFLPCLITGIVIGLVSYVTNKYDNLVVLTGVLCGIAVIIVMALYLLVTGKKIIDKSHLTKEELEFEKTYPLWQGSDAMDHPHRPDPYYEYPEGHFQLFLQDSQDPCPRPYGRRQTYRYEGPLAGLYLDLRQYNPFDPVLKTHRHSVKKKPLLPGGNGRQGPYFLRLSFLP